jgi:hypothetical protein
MTFRKAAIAMLRDAGKPLTAAELTEVALARGLIDPSGRTPVATLNATLYRTDPEIKRKAPRGQQRAIRGTVGWRYVVPK